MRKPVRSVGVERATHPAESAYPRKSEKLTTCIANLVLPLRADACDRDRAFTVTAIAFSLAFSSFALLHLPLAARSVSAGLVPRAAFIWNHLKTNHLGHLLLYGILIALLSYVEGVFAEGEDQISDHLLASGKVVVWAILLFGTGVRFCGGALDPISLATLAFVTGLEFWLIGYARYTRRRRGSPGDDEARNVLMVGADSSAREIAAHLARASHGQVRIKGFLSSFGSTDPSVLGTAEDLPQIARAEFIDEIVVSSSADHHLARSAAVAAIRNHLDVTVIPQLFSETPQRLRLRMVGRLPLIRVHEEPLPRLPLLLKRFVDVVCAALGLVVLSPLIALIAAAIKIESKGPVLYSAPRAGRKGNYFRCYKFRTMHVDADRHKELLRLHNERCGPTFKIVNDPRITALGRLLRRYSLDELPQLWNVVNGTMSMVGPRPHPLDDYRRYQLQDLRRLDVRPGIPGCGR